MILDSPLNKAGKVKGVYVHTSKNVLIQVNPQVSGCRRVHTSARCMHSFISIFCFFSWIDAWLFCAQVRLPRTFRRFCGLLVQLLQKLSIRATNGPDKLLRVVKGPVTRYLPTNARRIGFSFSAESIVAMGQHAQQMDDEQPLVFVVGAFAHGKIEDSYVDEYISISQFPLSAAYALSRITNALEQKWGIV